MDLPKKNYLGILKDALGLKDRTKLYWFLTHSKVREVIIKGQIYLNTSSLIESFFTATVGFFLIK